jgi:hypothetical protein
VDPELVGDMVTSFCDARPLLTESKNAVAARLFTSRREVDATDNDSSNRSDNDKDTNSQRTKVDLVVTSHSVGKREVFGRPHF